MGNSHSSNGIHSGPYHPHPENTSPSQQPQQQQQQQQQQQSHHTQKPQQQQQQQHPTPQQQQALQPSSLGSTFQLPTSSSSQGRPQFGPPPQRYAVSDQNSRITVDIRGADLASSQYNVFVKKQDGIQVQAQRVESSVRAVTNSVQSLGGVLVTCLTAWKLIEEACFLRSLRGELSSIAAAFGGAEGEAPQHQQSREASSKSMSAPTGPSSLAMMSSIVTPPNVPLGGTTWDKIAGLRDVKMLLQEATVLPILRPDLFTGIRQPPRGLLLFGPPGSGKTMLARAVATESRASFIAVTGSNILSMWYGQSEQNVKQLFERARKQQPAVIFIDEVDSLLGKRSGGGGGGGGGGDMGDSMPDKRVTNEFLSFIDGIQTEQKDSRIVIMAATNNPWDLDEAALSRFSRRIYVPLPNRHSRADLIKKAMVGVVTEISDEEYLLLADKLNKYSGRDLVQVCREASMRPLRELWGQRLLESGSEQQQLEQRLVSTVADFLIRGKPPARLRKELESWRRRNKSVAHWCSVDAILVQAERVVVVRTQAKQLQASGPGGSAGGAAADGGGDGGGCGGEKGVTWAASGNGNEMDKGGVVGAMPDGVVSVVDGLAIVAGVKEGGRGRRQDAALKKEAAKKLKEAADLKKEAAKKLKEAAAAAAKEAKHKVQTKGQKVVDAESAAPQLPGGSHPTTTACPTPATSAGQREATSAPSTTPTCSDTAESASPSAESASVCNTSADPGHAMSTAAAVSASISHDGLPSSSSSSSPPPSSSAAAAEAAATTATEASRARQTVEVADAGAAAAAAAAAHSRYAQTPEPTTQTVEIAGAGAAAASAAADSRHAQTPEPATGTETETENPTASTASTALTAPTAMNSDPPTPSTTTTPTTTHSNPSSHQPSSETTAKPSASSKDNNPTHKTRVVPGGSSSTAAGQGGTSKMLTWTIEELLALPAETLRPVAHADFDAALKQMMPCDVLGSRYEEWNQQYGSGADSKSAVQPAHMMMYM